MNTRLDPVEARILGSLIEKSFLTPETYPLSFAALQAACNQKTSREPVMALEPDTLRKGLASLTAKNLCAERLGSRVPKYAHHAETLRAGETPEVLGVLCLLLLRGPQTSAEIRARAERVCRFESNGEVEEVMQKLSSNPEGPFVTKLARGRYQHLFFGAPADAMVPLPAAAPGPDRLSLLEGRVGELEARCKILEERLGS